MEWSRQQAKALDMVATWMKDPHADQCFRMFGYAGTGKSTLAKHLASDVSGHVLFGAYTGKAAHVLQQKGCPAQTIHSLIYVPKGKSAEKLRTMEKLAAGMDPDDHRRARLVREIRKEQENLKRPSFALNMDSQLRTSDLVVIDECSMVDERMGEDLLSFGCKVLVLGDPAQLPPVRGGGFFTGHEPDMLLTEIHRQAAGNPIIDMATDVREGRPLRIGDYGGSKIVRELNADDVMESDQVIVGLNRTRHKVNQRMRQLHGFEGDVPMKGERLVCLRNNHDLGLLNGSIWYVEESFDDGADHIAMSIRPEEENWRQDVVAHRALFTGGELDWFERREAEEFDYGYALTCHKAQGSQFDDLTIINESGAFPRAMRRSWLYTSLTRAAERVTVKI